MIMHDKRLHILDRAGDVAAFALAKPDVREIFRSQFSVNDELARTFKVMREEDYYSSGIVGKLVWWDRNVWSDQKSFDLWMFLIMGRLNDGKGYINLPREDMKICVTHFANCTSPQKDQILSAMHWSMGFSVPLAMLARWSGRRALYLPMNGLQRLLLGVWMYAELSWISREMWYLHRIRDKDAAARVIVNLFGSFDQAFEAMGFDYSEPRDSDASD
ncbi:hypothetical protein GSI_07913 [Ganoderma sinense ZZ0214-1]|uniref:Uncharacterized protein n=1 Tax=Ganoderma sinense ZZ0214-1 TaxID=1077348 RepID=A0A2G8S890_9APHY|nr:hypothetical protein GSI_07913 [Ganoderma sinense ZZ0214-1]